MLRLPKLKNFITLCLLTSTLGLAYSNVRTPLDSSVVTKNKQHNLFWKADSVGKAITSGKIKTTTLPKVLPHTGYDPAVAHSPIIPMPNRSKYDAGILEGQKVEQYRKDKEAEEKDEQAKIMLTVLIVLFVISLITWLVVTIIKAHGGNTLIKNKKEK